ncbi:D,D-heptose 1,7-bisphosphate phosphatase [Helicobacter sp. CLO-3]|nr:D,D-heptose 1,7-bisphosphate phosphatase [Helicobacter sp. CLO-3]OHU83223.1 D,D-heptose 1,7-bisphosphate phosphatase [Helicobacter sp. CLO-3]
MKEVKKAVFFDRDGVINRDFGYVYRQEDFVFNEGIFDLLKFCKEKGFLLFVVTNQSGIARGFYTTQDFKTLSAYMQNELKRKLGFGFDSIYFCPHDPKEDCTCRKPKTGMIEQAKKDYDIKLGDCFIIGDKISDIQAGQKADIRYKILVGKAPKEQVAGISNLHIVANTKEIKEVMNGILQA